MRRNVSKFKIYEESTKADKYWANYADENVLLLTHPNAKSHFDLTDKVMQYISTASESLVGKRTPLQDNLKQSGRTRTVPKDSVTWRLKGTGEVQAVAMENLHPGVTNPGIQHSELSIKLDVEWFVEGDILAPDVAKECQVIVQSDPVADGTGFIYTVQIVDADPNAYFPPELLEPNLKWLKIGAAYGEASRGYGSTQFKGMSYVEFRSDLTDWGKSVEVTNKAHSLNLRLDAFDSNDRQLKEYPSQIISYIEANMLAEGKWEKELMLYYGRSAGKNIIDSTVGYHRRIGPGLLETFVGSGKSYDPKNYKGLKFQTGYFTEYNIFPFGSIKVEHWPILDSTWLNGSVLHPETGLPLSSYEYIVLDYGMGGGGSSNIELLQREDAEVFAYECGTWSPAGPINGRNSNFKTSGPQRSYTLYAADTFGLRVKDVTLTARFIPAVQY